MASVRAANNKNRDRVQGVIPAQQAAASSSSDMSAEFSRLVEQIAGQVQSADDGSLFAALDVVAPAASSSASSQRSSEDRAREESAQSSAQGNQAQECAVVQAQAASSAAGAAVSPSRTSPGASDNQAASNANQEREGDEAPAVEEDSSEGQGQDSAGKEAEASAEAASRVSELTFDQAAQKVVDADQSNSPGLSSGEGEAAATAEVSGVSQTTSANTAQVISPRVASNVETDDKGTARQDRSDNKSSADSAPTNQESQSAAPETPVIANQQAAVQNPEVASAPAGAERNSKQDASMLGLQVAFAALDQAAQGGMPADSALQASRSSDALVSAFLIKPAIQEAGRIADTTRVIGASNASNGNSTIVDSSAARNGSPQKAANDSAPKAPRASTRVNFEHAAEKVESVLREAAKARDGKSLSFRLDPPSLGSMKVDVTLRDGGLHARLVPESPQVAQLLRERAHELQQNLRKIGLEVDSVSVSVGGEAFANGADTDMFSSFSERSTNNQGKSGSGLPGMGDQVGAGTQTTPVAGGSLADHWVA